MIFSWLGMRGEEGLNSNGRFIQGQHQDTHLVIPAGITPTSLRWGYPPAGRTQIDSVAKHLEGAKNGWQVTLGWEGYNR